MTDRPWTGDACSLVHAYRGGERSPSEELAATFDAIEASDLNAFAHLDRERAEAALTDIDVSRPFGGVPLGVKELDSVQGWPQTDASLPFADAVAERTSTMVDRLESLGGALAIGLTTASEFGAVNVTRTLPRGATARRPVARLAVRRPPSQVASLRSLPQVTAAARSASPPASAGSSA
jgi:aspartyl-tRNA(Asn)/glutamyl-tRNA(Gln) amidotransferase subunit A